MVSRKSKTRKLRGHVSAGRGRIGKGRNDGANGKAGGLTFLRNHFDRYHPGFFGKIGIPVYHRNKNHTFCPVLNLEKLMSVLSVEQRTEIQKSEKIPVIDITKAGYYKLLGKGLAPTRPVIVRARFVSAVAEKKIVAAGGAVELIA
ncbi:hypothetical protein PCE1_004254 [Barthelona sp. PCE]